MRMKMKMFFSLLNLSVMLRVSSVALSSLQCSMSPAGVLHPVQSQLERVEYGTGCIAREPGAKETHVVSIDRPPHRQVTVVLRPLSLSRPVDRPVILVLSSQHAVHWLLEREGLSHNINVLVQVSGNSTAESSGFSVRVTQVRSLPHTPRVLLRWVLQRHQTLSSLAHAAGGSRVYLRLGEDPSMPTECRLRPLFLSQSQLISELQEQQVHGCASDQLSDTEVHIIRLWAAGSGPCGSLPPEISVSLLPPEAGSGFHKVFMILSSAEKVNWTLFAPGVRGHLRLYSSGAVRLPYGSHSPDLTLTSTVTSDLNTPNLLEWTNQNGFPPVTSYSEVDLANRFVIKLREGDSDHVTSEERHHDDIILNSRDALRCQFEDGSLAVSLDTQMLKVWPLASVTLRDQDCQGQFNGSHFLLLFPVTSCGTEGVMDGERVHYTNTVFLWKRSPGETLWDDWDERSHLAVHLSCESSLLAPERPSVMAPSVRPEEALRLHAALAPAPAPAPPWLLEARAAPLLSMELFVTDAFEKRAVGPCVISAQERLYVQIMVVSAALEAVELQSCVVSPLSGPQAHRGWSIIKDSCPADASFALLSLGRNIQRDEEDPEKPEHVQDPRSERWRNHGDEALRGLPESFRSGNLGEAHQDGAEAPDGESLNPLRFSFVLQPVFNNSIQFLHCRLRVCSGGEGRAGAPACADGTRVPPLTLTAASTQCEDRNLSRPVLVTSPAGFLAPPAGKLAQKPAEMSRQTPSPADEAPVLLLVFGAFLMGLSLMGALWCIYTHTGRRDLSQSETMEVEAMGNSRTQMEQTSSFHEGN